MVDPLFPLPYLSPGYQDHGRSVYYASHWCRRRSGRRDYG